MICPNCRTDSLVRVKSKKADVELDVCRKCKGVWFDREEINLLLDVAAKELKVPNGAKESMRACPHCRRLLYTFDYPQTLVPVDMCRKCDGLWLDAGEGKEIKSVRERLQRKGELDEYAPVAGLKGGLLSLINKAIEVLS